MTTLFPDPSLTANIYCSGLLDRVIYQAVVPFWQEFRSNDPGRLSYLWLMRYGAGGEHLKVRIHGPDFSRPIQLRLLEEKVVSFLDSLPAAAPSFRSQERAPAIDAEDTRGDHPDHTFLWTNYARSHISLGSEPFLSDDRYTALLTRCLAQGCELLLASETGADGSLSHSLRLRLLLWAAISGFSALGFSAEKRAQYHAYHRDWLLRSVLPADRRFDADPLEEIRRRLDERITRSGDFLSAVQRMACTEWVEDEMEPHDGFPDEGWPQSLADLLAYVSLLCRDPLYHFDPFASDPTFAPIFKLFHGLANQFGLRGADEAFIHHALFRNSIL